MTYSKAWMLQDGKIWIYFRNMAHVLLNIAFSNICIPGKFRNKSPLGNYIVKVNYKSELMVPLTPWIEASNGEIRTEKYLCIFKVSNTRYWIFIFFLKVIFVWLCNRSSSVHEEQVNAKVLAILFCSFNWFVLLTVFVFYYKYSSEY